MLGRHSRNADTSCPAAVATARARTNSWRPTKATSWGVCAASQTVPAPSLGWEFVPGLWPLSWACAIVDGWMGYCGYRQGKLVLQRLLPGGR